MVPATLTAHLSTVAQASPASIMRRSVPGTSARPHRCPTAHALADAKRVTKRSLRPAQTFCAGKAGRLSIDAAGSFQHSACLMLQLRSSKQRPPQSPQPSGMRARLTYQLTRLCFHRFISGKVTQGIISSASAGFKKLSPSQQKRGAAISSLATFCRSCLS